jgi:hypothetical protein
MKFKTWLIWITASSIGGIVLSEILQLSRDITIEENILYVVCACFVAIMTQVEFK